MASSTGVVPKPVVTILMLFIGCLLLDSVVFVSAKEGGDRPTGKSSIAKSNADNLDVSGVADAGFGGEEEDENPPPLSPTATAIEEEDQNVVAAKEVEHPASPVAAGHDHHHLLPAGSSHLHLNVGGHGGGNNNHGVHQGQPGVHSSPESGKPMSPSGHGHRSPSPSKATTGDSGSVSPRADNPRRSGSPPRRSGPPRHGNGHDETA